MNEQEFEKAFSDPKFVNMLLNLETGEEVKKALADKGIDLSPDELDKFAEVLLCTLQKSKELKDEDMSKISGGVSMSELSPRLQKALKLVVGIGVATIGVGGTIHLARKYHQNSAPQKMKGMSTPPGTKSDPDTYRKALEIPTIPFLTVD